MKNLFILAVIASFVLACGGNGGPKISDAEIAKGKATYKTLCIACHGSNGEMALNGAKKFGESTLNLDERKLIIANGRGLMTPFKEILSEEEIKNVALYTLELTKAAKQ